MELELIQKKIYTVRGRRVMLDVDLATLYDVETRRLKEAVRRNRERFPEDFMYELTNEEYQSLRSQIATLKTGIRGGHSKYAPFAFTEQGISMLSGVLHSPRAIEMHITIMRAFIAMRQFIFQYQDLAAQITEIRASVAGHNDQLTLIYDAIENILDDRVEQRTWENREPIGFRRDNPPTP